MFRSRREVERLEKLLAVATSTTSDLKQRIRDLEEQNRELLDRILALTRPGVLREVRPSPPSDPTPPQPELPRRFPHDRWVDPANPPSPPDPRLPNMPSRQRNPSPANEEAS